MSKRNMLIGKPVKIIQKKFKIQNIFLHLAILNESHSILLNIYIYMYLFIKI